MRSIAGFLCLFVFAIICRTAHSDDYRFRFANGKLFEYTYYHDDDGTLSYSHARIYPKKESGNSDSYEHIVGTSLGIRDIHHVQAIKGKKAIVIQNSQGLFLVKQSGETAEFPLPDRHFASGYGNRLKMRHWKISTKRIQKDHNDRILIEIPISDESNSVYLSHDEATDEILYLGEKGSSMLDTITWEESSEGALQEERLFTSADLAESKELRTSTSLKSPKNAPVLINPHQKDRAFKETGGDPWYSNQEQLLEARRIQNDMDSAFDIWAYRHRLSSFKMSTLEQLTKGIREKLLAYYAKYYPEAKVETHTINGWPMITVRLGDAHPRTKQLEGAGLNPALVFEPEKMMQGNYSAGVRGKFMVAPLDLLLNPDVISPTFEHEIEHGRLKQLQSPLSLSFFSEKQKLPGEPGAYGNFFTFEELVTYQVSLDKLREKLAFLEDARVEKSHLNELRESIEDKLTVYARSLPYFADRLKDYKRWLQSQDEATELSHPFLWPLNEDLTIEVEIMHDPAPEKVTIKELLDQVQFIEEELQNSKEYLQNYKRWFRWENNLVSRALKMCLSNK